MAQDFFRPEHISDTASISIPFNFVKFEKSAIFVYRVTSLITISKHVEEANLNSCIK